MPGGLNVSDQNRIGPISAPEIGVRIGDLDELSLLLPNTRATRSFVQSVYRDPQGFVVSFVKIPLLRLIGPIIATLPAVVENIDNEVPVNPLEALFTEVCILLKHGIPRYLVYMQEQSIVLAPIIAVGHLSTLSLAATTISNTIASVTGFSIISGLTGALDHVLNPKSYSSRFPAFWCFCVSLILIAALVPVASLWSYAELPLFKMRLNSEAVHLTILSLHLTAIGIPAFAANEVFKRYLSSQGLGAVHTRLSSLAAILNGVLNYVLVHGPPRVQLGFSGASIATAICYHFVAISTALYVLFIPRTMLQEVVDTEMSKQQITKPSILRGLGLILFHGLGGVARTATVSWSRDIVGFSLALLGPTSLAAQAVLIATTSTVYQASRAISQCSQHRISYLLADSHVNRARVAVTATALVMLGTLLGTCNILILFSDSLSNIFTNDSDVNHAVRVTLPLICLYIAAQGLGACVDHLLRVCKKSALYPGLTLTFDFFGGIPFALWLAFGKDMGLYGLWVGLTASLLCSLVVSLIVLVHSQW